MDSPRVYIVDYYAKRGPLDRTIGVKKSLLMVAMSKEDAESTFIRCNPNCNLIGIRDDKRQVGLSSEYLNHVLQSRCPGYMKSIKMKAKLDDEISKQGYQYKGTIENNTTSTPNSLLRGVI